MRQKAQFDFLYSLNRSISQVTRQEIKHQTYNASKLHAYDVNSEERIGKSEDMLQTAGAWNFLVSHANRNFLQ
jgi:hypothetical protein